MKMSLEINVSMKMLVETTVEDEVTQNLKGINGSYFEFKGRGRWGEFIC